MPSQRSQTPLDADVAVAVFVEYRPRLLGIAHRVLGSAVEAEDVLQEVWLRWQKTDHSTVVSPAAFLATVTTRLALDVVQSARVRRETAMGPWLAEPVDIGPDPESRVQQHEDLALALLLLLKRLTPAERAAFLLREAFDYGYPEERDAADQPGQREEGREPRPRTSGTGAAGSRQHGGPQTPAGCVRRRGRGGGRGFPGGAAHRRHRCPAHRRRSAPRDAAVTGKALVGT
ncbi:hypothetical protein STENM327S_08410 [Streptomyces tendae]